MNASLSEERTSIVVVQDAAKKEIALAHNVMDKARAVKIRFNGFGRAQIGDIGAYVPAIFLLRLEQGWGSLCL